MLFLQGKGCFGSARHIHHCCLSICSTQLHFDLIIPSDGWLWWRKEVGQPADRRGYSQRQHSIAIKGPAERRVITQSKYVQVVLRRIMQPPPASYPSVRRTLLTQALRAYQPDLLALPSFLPSFPRCSCYSCPHTGRTTAEPSA